MRPTKSGMLDANAYCCDCDWEAGTRNAQGIAAQHHDRTGHDVHVNITNVVLYGCPGGHGAKGSQRGEPIR